ncbi:MAG TPA: DUF5658 family protein [Aliidongia sp.]|nr:DUF5658 family protein [Aliidongia sp.]
MSEDRSVSPRLAAAPHSGNSPIAGIKRLMPSRTTKLLAIRVLLIALALAQLGDVLSTNQALAASPGAFEANPLMHLLMTYLGSWWWLWKAAMAGFFVVAAFTIRQPSRRQLVFAGAVAKVYVLVLVNNLLQ